MAIDQTTLTPTKIPSVYTMADGRFLIRVSVRLAYGKVKHSKRVMDAKTKPDDLKQAVLNLKAEARMPPPPPVLSPLPVTTSQTLEDYANQWGKTRSARLKPSAAQSYRACLEKHILPFLGHLKCQDVTRGAVEAWVVWAEGRVMTRERRTEVLDTDGKVVRQGNHRLTKAAATVTEPYAQATMRQWWQCLKTMLCDMAADLGLNDPTTRIRPPERPQQAPKREQRTVETADLATMLEAARVHAPDRYAEIAVLALTGMRSGELYALKWDCVDTEKLLIVVKRSISLKVLTETTKTKAQRTVPMHPLVAELLKAHRHEQIKNQVAGLELGLVFPSEKGTPRTPNTLQKAFQAIRKASGMDIKIGPQVLRRSMNSNLLRHAVDRLTVRAIMGHTTEEMTARYYGVSEGDKKAAVLSLPVKQQ